MTKRFDLEQDIMSCWMIVDDLKYVQEAVQDNDTASNIVNGLISLYQMKFEKCFNTFEKVIAEGATKASDPEWEFEFWSPYKQR